MQRLNAYMNGELVGTLTKQNNGSHEIKYNESWLSSDKSRPLSLSLKLQIPTLTSDAVINYFDNLLPDNIAIRNRIVARYQTA
ncbi:HipA N-terminal domain-containing protein, partial [Vibrio coralliirubri]|uniref:HipA N-terminal domain-containing protein n=1 Tax=Vibrio coralliirubri TaxID=1516159 RepID=UPI00065E70EE